MEVIYTENSVTWEYAGKHIEVNLDHVQHADFDESQNIIYVKTGESVSAKWIRYYNLNSHFLARENLETGEFIWQNNGEHQLSIPFTETVGFYPNYELILIIYRRSEERTAITAMNVYDLNGNLVRQFDSPQGYRMRYVTDIENNQARVVCDATIKENYESYGRSSFMFSLDLNTGEWVKTGLAY